MGWEPSRFLVDRAEAERACALGAHLGSVDAAAVELGTTGPSLRKAFQRHELGMPAATSRRSGNAPSLRPASAAVSRPPPTWTRPERQRDHCQLGAPDRIWCFWLLGLLCSVNDAVNVLSCSAWPYLHDWLS